MQMRTKLSLATKELKDSQHYFGSTGMSVEMEEVYLARKSKQVAVHLMKLSSGLTSSSLVM